MKCNRCGSTKIKMRKNYSHGKKSKAIVTLVCRECNSNSIDKQEDPRGRGRFRKR